MEYYTRKGWEDKNPHLLAERQYSAVSMVIASTATGCVAHQEASPMR